jgi:hypothetical protein
MLPTTSMCRLPASRLRMFGSNSGGPGGSNGVGVGDGLEDSDSVDVTLSVGEGVLSLVDPGSPSYAASPRPATSVIATATPRPTVRTVRSIHSRYRRMIGWVHEIRSRSLWLSVPAVVVLTFAGCASPSDESTDAGKGHGESLAALYTSGRADEAQIKQICAKAAAETGKAGYSAGDLEPAADEVDEVTFRQSCKDAAMAE